MPKNKRKIIGTIVAATVLIGLIYYVGYSTYHQQHLSQNAATSPPPKNKRHKPILNILI